MTASRASIAAAAVTLVVLALTVKAANRASRLRIIASAAAVMVIAMGAYGLYESSGGSGLPGGGIVKKFQQNEASNEVLSFRDRLWANAFAGVRQYPLFGVGLDNFGELNIDRVCAWEAARREDHGCNRNRYYYANHAHSLYMNTLAERGWVGLSVLLLVLGAGFISLWKRRAATTPGAETVSIATAMWGVALGALMVTSVGGLLNTTLHHENALLTLILFSLWRGQRELNQVA